MQTKAWCYYESRLLGAHHGLLSSYALEVLVLHICNVFHSTVSTPLQVRQCCKLECSSISNLVLPHAHCLLLCVHRRLTTTRRRTVCGSCSTATCLCNRSCTASCKCTAASTGTRCA